MLLAKICFITSTEHPRASSAVALDALIGDGPEQLRRLHLGDGGVDGVELLRDMELEAAIDEHAMPVVAEELTRGEIQRRGTIRVRRSARLLARRYGGAIYN